MSVLVKTAAGLKAFNQNVHFLQFAKGQVRDDAQQPLQNAGVGAHKWRVDLIKEHHQLVLVACQEQVTLQE